MVIVNAGLYTFKKKEYRMNGFMKVDLLSLDKEVRGEVELRDEVFGTEFRPDIIHRVVRWQNAKRMQGTHSSKTISEVSGTTRKPFRQKGTGRARLGSLRAVQCRGGGISMGPVTRSHAHKLPKKVRGLGLRSILSERLKSGLLYVIDSERCDSHKVSGMLAMLKKWDFDGKCLVVVGDEPEQNFMRATRNISHVRAISCGGINVYDIMLHDNVLLTADAVEYLHKRFVDGQ